MDTDIRDRWDAPTGRESEDSEMPRWGWHVVDGWDCDAEKSEYIVHWDNTFKKKHINISFAGDEVAVMLDKHDAMALIKQLQVAVREMDS